MLHDVFSHSLKGGETNEPRDNLSSATAADLFYVRTDIYARSLARLFSAPSIPEGDVRFPPPPPPPLPTGSQPAIQPGALKRASESNWSFTRDISFALLSQFTYSECVRCVVDPVVGSFGYHRALRVLVNGLCNPIFANLQSMTKFAFALPNASRFSVCLQRFSMFFVPAMLRRGKKSRAAMPTI